VITDYGDSALKLTPSRCVAEWRSSALAEQVAPKRIVGAGKAGASTAVGALGDVVKVAGNDDAGEGPYRIVRDPRDHVN
jgi:hypothetical protein